MTDETDKEELARFGIGLILFAGYLWVIMSTTAVMAHNSPLNTVDNVTNGSSPFDKAKPKMKDDGKYPGVTYGRYNATLSAQAPTFASRLITPFLIPSFFIALIFWTTTFVLFSNDSHLIKGVGIAIGIIVYLSSIILMYELSPNIHYIVKDSWEPISIFSAILKQKLHRQLFALILFQSVISLSLPFIWSRNLIPEYKVNTSATEVPLYKPEALLLNLENWRQYGTWSATLMGGVTLSAVIAYISNATGFGSLFVIHALVLIGGASGFQMAYILYKIHALERKIANLPHFGT